MSLFCILIQTSLYYFPIQYLSFKEAFDLVMQRQELNDTSGEPNIEQDGQFVSTNTSFIHILAMIPMGICRKILSNKLIKIRLFIYLSLVLIGGLLNDLAPLLTRSTMFKVHKTNVLKHWFVKMGWLWTTLLICPLMELTSSILSSRNKDTFMTIFKRRFPYLLRYFINTFIWWESTKQFRLIDNWTGSKFLSRFDISGHTFLLIYPNLILIEESVVMIGWERFGQHLFEQMNNTGRRQRVLQHEYQFKLYKLHSQTLRILFVLITILSLIWDFMLVQTLIFSHTIFQKLVAVIWAIIAWWITYQFYYKRIGINVRAPRLDNN